MPKAKSILELQEYSEGRMLFRLAWPVILSLLVQGFYSLVDSFYLSKLGEEVLSAVSLSFVIQTLSSGFFSGIATGMNVLISRAIGAGDYSKAKSAVVNGIVVQLLLVLVMMVFGLFFVPQYFRGTTDIEQVIAYGIEYLTPCMVFIIASAGQVTFERFLQSTGVTKYMLFAQGAGSVVNIVLDPIMIFGYLGCPAMGIKGAAYATIIGQFVAFFLAVLFNVKRNGMIFSGLNSRLADLRTALSICKIGIPLAATSIAGSFGNYFINRILIGFSAAANAAFGVYAKLQSVALMPTLGFTAGLVTILSFFCGKKDPVRIRRSLITGEIIIGIWNVICFLFFFLFPAPILKVFNASAEMLDVGKKCFRIIGLTYLTSGLMAGPTAFFHSLGKTVYSLLVSLSRQVFVRVPVAFYLASFRMVNLIWWCWPISEVTSDIVIVILFVRVYRRFMKRMRNWEAGIPSGHVLDQKQ